VRAGADLGRIGPQAWCGDSQRRFVKTRFREKVREAQEVELTTIPVDNVEKQRLTVREISRKTFSANLADC
jgi:hypothetical protein